MATTISKLAFPNLEIWLIRLCGAIFLSAGAWVSSLTYVEDTMPWDQLAGFTVVSTLCGSIGLGMIIHAWMLRKRLAMRAGDESAALRPWLARTDWANGKVWATNDAEVARTIAGTAYWILATLPLVTRLPEIIQQVESGWKWATLAFPLIDGGMLLCMFYYLARRHKFGVPIFHLTGASGVIGGHLAGQVRIPQLVLPSTGFRVKLSCLQRSENGDGVPSENVVWEDERLVTASLRREIERGTDVPVMFAIPNECPATSQGECEWRLAVTARLPGIDYGSQFDVPVFPMPSGQSVPRSDEVRLSAAVSAADVAMLLGEAGVTRETLPDGQVQLVFAAARQWGLALTVTVLWAAWIGVIGIMIRTGANIFIPIMFGAGALLSVKPILALWFYRSIVVASGKGMRVESGLWGRGKEQFVAADEIDDFGSTVPGSAGLAVDLRVIRRDGESITIAKGIASKLVEKAVFQELDAALGRSEIDARLAKPSPCQHGEASVTGQGATPTAQPTRPC